MTRSQEEKERPIQHRQINLQQVSCPCTHPFSPPSSSSSFSSSSQFMVLRLSFIPVFVNRDEKMIRSSNSSNIITLFIIPFLVPFILNRNWIWWTWNGNFTLDVLSSVRKIAQLPDRRSWSYHKENSFAFCVMFVRFKNREEGFDGQIAKIDRIQIAETQLRSEKKEWILLPVIESSCKWMFVG